MRTRPPSPSPSRPLRLLLVGLDGLARVRLAAVARRAPLDLRFADSYDASLDAGADAVILPARELGAIGEAASGARRPILVAFGPGELLRRAFLAGCDDYLRDPWEVDELEARVLRLADRLVRRPAPLGDGMELDGRTVRLPGGREVRLSAHEAVVAGLLFANRGIVVSRRALSYALWGRALERESRAIDVHVSALRRKLGRQSIACVRGQGYLVD